MLNDQLVGVFPPKGLGNCYCRASVASLWVLRRITELQIS